MMFRPFTLVTIWLTCAQGYLVDNDDVKQPAIVKPDDLKEPAAANKLAAQVGAVTEQVLLQAEQGTHVEEEDLLAEEEDDNEDLLTHSEGDAVPAFTEEKFEEQATSHTGFAWTPKGVRKGMQAKFFKRKPPPFAGSPVSGHEFQQFGKAGVGSIDQLLQHGYIQPESPTALTMEEAEEQANLYVWTPRGIEKGVGAGFFQQGSVPSKGQIVSAEEFQHFSQILASKTDNPALMLLNNHYLARNVPDVSSFLATAGTGRRGKGRKGKGRKGKGRKGKGRKGKGRHVHPIMLSEEGTQSEVESQGKEHDESKVELVAEGNALEESGGRDDDETKGDDYDESNDESDTQGNQEGNELKDSEDYEEDMVEADEYNDAATDDDKDGGVPSEGSVAE